MCLNLWNEDFFPQDKFDQMNSILGKTLYSYRIVLDTCYKIMRWDQSDYFKLSKILGFSQNISFLDTCFTFSMLEYYEVIPFTPTGWDDV